MSTADGAPVSSNGGPQNISSNDNKSTRKLLKDDDICDDWEQLDQQQIKKSLQSIKITQANDNEEKNIKGIAKPNISTAAFPSNNPMTSNNPIKILRRPPSDKNLKEMSGQNQSQAQPIKTFEQREQEYAQARLRILGSAHPEQDTSSANTSGNNNYASNIGSKNVSSQQANYTQNMPLNQQIPNNPAANNFNVNNSNYSNNKNPGFNMMNNSNNPMGLIRDPIGPSGEGNRGFNNNNNRYYNNNQNNSNSNNNSTYKN